MGERRLAKTRRGWRDVRVYRSEAPARSRVSTYGFLAQADTRGAACKVAEPKYPSPDGCAKR
jgi:hypothetical protein